MLTPEIIKAMVASGCTVETLAAVVIEDYRAEQEKLLEKRAIDRKRKQNQRSRHADNTGQPVTPLPPCPPSDKEKVSRPLKEINSPLNPPSPFNINSDFEFFWRAYPRREGKKNAMKAYQKARKSTPHTEIMAGLERYKAANGSQYEFYAHPATWLNGQRWLDEIQPNVIPLTRKLSNRAAFEIASRRIDAIFGEDQSGDSPTLALTIGQPLSGDREYFAGNAASDGPDLLSISGDHPEGLREPIGGPTNQI